MRGAAAAEWHTRAEREGHQPVGKPVLKLMESVFTEFEDPVTGEVITLPRFAWRAVGEVNPAQ